MGKEYDIMMKYNKLDLEMINSLHKQIQELLKHQITMDNRKRKIKKICGRLAIKQYV